MAGAQPTRLAALGLDLLPASRPRQAAAEEQLEENLDPAHFQRCRLSQPVVELSLTGLGDGKGPALRPPVTAGPGASHQAFGFQPAQDGIDLAVALASEVPDTILCQLLDIVA